MNHKNQLDLSRHKALVTGASRGIGAATAKMLAAFGAEVFINYLEDENEAKIIANEIKKAGGKVSIVQADVSDIKQIQRMAKEIGDITLLVNNAGVIVRPAAWNEISDFDFIWKNNKHWFNVRISWSSTCRGIYCR